MMELGEAFLEAMRAVAREEIARAEQKRRESTDGYLSTEAAAEFADVAVGTIRRWVREGKLPEHRAGRRVRVLRSELARLLDGGRRPTKRAKLSPEERAAQILRTG